MSQSMISYIIDLQFTMNKQKIIEIFGVENSTHLHNKWLNCNDNLLLFLNKLDTGNRNMFYTYVSNNSTSN